MNRQDIFNTSVGELLKQGKKSVDGEGVCAYRGADGSKCAIGHLIPDSMYHPSYEGLDVNGLEGQMRYFLRSASFANTLYGHYDENKPLLADLQDIHDAVSPKYWTHEYYAIAKKYGLEWKFG